MRFQASFSIPAPASNLTTNFYPLLLLQVSIWNQNLELGHTFETKALGSVEFGVQSIAWDPG